MNDEYRIVFDYEIGMEVIEIVPPADPNILEVSEEAFNDSLAEYIDSPCG